MQEGALLHGDEFHQAPFEIGMPRLIGIPVFQNYEIELLPHPGILPKIHPGTSPDHNQMVNRQEYT